MAHERTEIDLGPGLTVLTGPNNSGKSAVVEGLRCLASNPAPKHFIRHGASRARVEALLDNGFRVAWVRSKTSAIYEVWAPGADGPETYAKFGRRPPGDVLDLLKLDPVELETGQEIDVHLGNQREPVFLLNQPPSAAAAFFAASTESVHLLAMQNLLKRKTLEAKRDEAAHARRMEDIARDLDRLGGLPDLALDLELANAQRDRLDRLEGLLPGLEAAISARLDLESDLQRLQQAAKAVRGLGEPPGLWPARPLEQILDQGRGLEKKQARARALSAGLEALAPPPDLFPTTALAQAAAAGRELRAGLGRFKAQDRVLDGLQQAPTLFETARLKDLALELSRCAGRIAGLGAGLEACGRDIGSLRRRIEKRLAEIGACPTCGSRMDLGRFLDGEGHVCS